ncbi:MAG: DUF4123 domain-containing protein [Pseudomonadota bacterium]
MANFDDMPWHDPRETGTFFSITPIAAPLPADDALPDALHVALFGVLPNTPDSAGWRSYAVVDASKHPLLPELLDDFGLRHQSLYDGDTADQLLEVSPYLVEITADTPRVLQYFKADTGPGDLWDSQLAVFLRSSAPFDEVRAFLRRFVQVPDETGTHRFFRFFDPVVLLPYFHSIQGQDRLASPWFSRIPIAFVICSAVLGETAIVEAQETADASAEQRVDVDSKILARNHAFLEMQSFAEEQEIPFEPPLIDSYGYDFTRFSDADIRIVVLLHLYFRKPKRYDPDTLYADQVPDVAKQEYLNKLLFFKEQKVPLDL